MTFKSNCSSYVQNMIESMILTSHSDKTYRHCRKLRWICRKHSNDVARQVETPGFKGGVSNSGTDLGRRGSDGVWFPKYWLSLIRY